MQWLMFVPTLDLVQEMVYLINGDDARWFLCWDVIRKCNMQLSGYSSDRCRVVPTHIAVIPAPPGWKIASAWMWKMGKRHKNTHTLLPSQSSPYLSLYVNGVPVHASALYIVNTSHSNTYYRIGRLPSSYEYLMCNLAAIYSGTCWEWHAAREMQKTVC